MKYTLLLLIIFLSIVIYSTVKYPTGIVGLTKLNGNGCICHNLETDSTVFVWISGPDSLQIGQSAIYKLFLTGGPKVKGGYNVAARFGSLAVIDTFSKIIDSELTHTIPKPFDSQDTISWAFEYTAPNTIGSDTIYSVAMSVNGDEIPTDEDKWNFGNNFVVRIVPPLSVENGNIVSLQEFELGQNYPNPFNPSTKIQYRIPNAATGLAQSILKVYDLLGNEVATLVNAYRDAGRYEIEFNASGLASGIYYYRLESGQFNQTKKMILLR